MKKYLIEIEIPLSIHIEKKVQELVTYGFDIDNNFKPKKLKVSLNQNTHHTFIIKALVKERDVSKCKVIPYVKNCWSLYDIIPFKK